MQQPEANAFVTDHYGRMKTQAVQEHNRVHNARKHEKVENHSSAAHVNNKNCHAFIKQVCEHENYGEGRGPC